MRALVVVLTLIGLLACGPPAAAGDRPFDLLSIGYHSRHGAFYGLARIDSLPWAEMRTGVIFGGGRSAVQVGLYRRWLPDLTTLVAINEPLGELGPRSRWDFSRQYHGDIFWKNLFGLSLDGKGDQQQLSLNIWKIPIPIAGRIDGVPWVLR